VSYGMMRISLGAKLIIIADEPFSTMLDSQYESLEPTRRIRRKRSLILKEMMCMQLKYWLSIEV
jgi:hypothetical protein